MPAPTNLIAVPTVNVGATIGRPHFLRPILFPLFPEKEKNRRGVRRSSLHSVFTGTAKVPHLQSPPSFPNCDRFTGSQFGHLEFYNAARDLDDGGQTASFEYGKTKTSIRRKSRARLWSMESPGNHSKGSLVVSFLFLLEPKGDPAQRSAFGKEEGGCEYGAFAAQAEAEWSRLLLTLRRFFSFSEKRKKRMGAQKCE